MQQILNDKFGLSYLSGNAQYLYANTATTQNFDTIIANTFTQYSNVFTINTSGVYGLSFTTEGNVSGANIIISGNLYLKEGFGEIGQFITRTSTGVSWSNPSFNGGTITEALTIASSAPSTSTTTGALIVQGGSAFWGNLYANTNAVFTGTNVSISNVQIGYGWNYTRFRSNANLILANAQTLHVTNGNVTTLYASNFVSSNGTITGSSSGIGSAKASSTSNNWTVSAIGNLYSTNGVVTNFSTANGSITGTSSGIGAIRSSASSNNWTVSAIGNLYSTNGMITNFSSGNVVIRGGVAATPPLRLTAGTSTTVAAAGAIEYDGTAFYAVTSTSLGRSYITTPVFSSGIGTSGATGATEYALFPSGNDTITLPIGTYKVSMSYTIGVTGSTDVAFTSLAMRGPGTAVGSFSGTALSAGSLSGGLVQMFRFESIALGSSTQVSTTFDASSRVYVIEINGILRITTAGTIIPSYLFNATLNSGTVTLYSANRITIMPISNSGTTTVVGAWS
jgi:hypothetical protein